MNIVEIAVKMEQDAVNFYTEASAKMNSKIGKEMFLKVAEDEKTHLKVVNQLIKNLDIKFKDTSPLKEVKTIFEKMKKDMLKNVSVTKDELEAFKVAMKMEKEGIIFYKKAAKQLKIDKEKKLFEMLVKQEEEHYKIFSNTYSFLLDTGSWFMWDEHGIVDGPGN